MIRTLQVVYACSYVIVPLLALYFAVKRMTYLEAWMQEQLLYITLLAVIIIILMFLLSSKQLPDTLPSILQALVLPLTPILIAATTSRISAQEIVMEISMIYAGISTITYFYFITLDAVIPAKTWYKKVHELVIQLPFIGSGVIFICVLWAALYSGYIGEYHLFLYNMLFIAAIVVVNSITLIRQIHKDYYS